MKVLITGGMGVIGAETSRKFVKEGHRPVIFARHRDDSLIGDIADKIDFEQGDVLDMPRILQAIKKHQVTHVVHAAAFVGAVSAANPALSIQVNVMGLVNVLEAARALGVTARGVHQREGRLRPGHRRIRLADLEADVRGPAGKTQAHLRLGQVHGRERLHLLQRQHGHRDGVAALCLDLRSRQDRAARPDGGDEPHRREPGERPAVQARTGRRRQGRLHLQQGFRARHLSRDRRRQGEEPRLQHRHRRRASRCATSSA